MLEIRLNCENCKKPLPPQSLEARICSYECTFCQNCVDQILENVCPNCGGGFEKRPIRTKKGLEKHPPSYNEIYKPVDLVFFKKIKEKLSKIEPSKR